MEITLAATTSASEQGATIHVALELSKSHWVVGIHTPLAEKVSRYAVPGGDSEALLNRAERIRDKVARHFGRPVAVVSC